MSSELPIHVLAVDSAAYAEALELREQVLRRPLGLPGPTDAELERERAAVHLGALEQGRVVATLLLEPHEIGVTRMRQVAVEPAHRRRGLGRTLVRAAVALCRARGDRLLFANARATALPFYEQLGWDVVGEEFILVTLPHRRVEMSLGPELPRWTNSEPTSA